MHSYVTPTVGGKTYWVTNNDGMVPMLATNTLRFLDLTPDSPTYLQPVGEITLPGMGHHKNAYSVERARVSVSNIADCNSALSVIDYTNVGNPTVVKSFAAVEIDEALGAACATRGAVPHGGGFSPVGKRGYHNLTGWGKILVGRPGRGSTDLQADGHQRLGERLHQNRQGRALRLLAAESAARGRRDQAGSRLSDRPAGRHRRDDGQRRPGDAAAVQGWQLCRQARRDRRRDGRTGADEDLGGRQDDVRRQPGHTGGGSLEPRYSDQLQIIDITDPANPVQKPSITIGKHSGHRAMALTGDGRYLYVANGNDSTISQLEIATGAVKTIVTKGKPTSLATWGRLEGPSAQTGPD